MPIGIYIEGAGSGVQIVNNHIHDITTTAATTPKKCSSNALGMAVYGSRAPASIDGLVIGGNEIDDLHTGLQRVHVGGRQRRWICGGQQPRARQRQYRYRCDRFREGFARYGLRPGAQRRDPRQPGL
ncbi:MAG: hypothetical protein WDN04_06475 [Rhodospirillales bacterium]